MQHVYQMACLKDKSAKFGLYQTVGISMVWLWPFGHFLAFFKQIFGPGKPEMERRLPVSTSKE